MKQKRGELIGYNGCLGYVYDKDTKKISINYEEAEIVRYIFERYCQGVGCTTIAKELTNGIIPTVERPAAMPTILHSAMPQSICLSG